MELAAAQRAVTNDRIAGVLMAANGAGDLNLRKLAKLAPVSRPGTA